MQEILDHTTVRANLTVDGVTKVADPVNATDAMNKGKADALYVAKTQLIIGPVGSVPALGDGQIYFGY